MTQAELEIINLLANGLCFAAASIQDLIVLNKILFERLDKLERKVNQ